MSDISEMERAVDKLSVEELEANILTNEVSDVDKELTIPKNIADEIGLNDKPEEPVNANEEPVQGADTDVVNPGGEPNEPVDYSKKLLDRGLDVNNSQQIFDQLDYKQETINRQGEELGRLRGQINTNTANTTANEAVSHSKAQPFVIDKDADLYDPQVFAKIIGGVVDSRMDGIKDYISDSNARLQKSANAAIENANIQEAASLGEYHPELKVNGDIRTIMTNMNDALTLGQDPLKSHPDAVKVKRLARVVALKKNYPVLFPTLKAAYDHDRVIGDGGLDNHDNKMKGEGSNQVINQINKNSAGAKTLAVNSKGGNPRKLNPDDLTLLQHEELIRRDNKQVQDSGVPDWLDEIPD